MILDSLQKGMILFMGKKVDLSKTKGKAKGFLTEFKEFAMKGNLIDMAVGVIIGAAFGTIVSSLVNDIIMPIIGKLTGGLDFSEWFWDFGAGYNSLAEAQEAGASVLSYGNFITAVINFLIVALVLFIVLKKILAPKKKKGEPEPAPTTKECPYCKSTIAIDATRCPHCTSELK